MELVSVIIPVYNAAGTLKQCLDSILNQTYKEIEVILINDGSKDESEKICKDYTELYQNVYYFSQENAGSSTARNAGMEKAQGMYYCFVDADDTIKADFIEHLLFLRTEYHAQLTICGYDEIKDGVIQNLHQSEVMILDQQRAICELYKENSFRGYVWNKLFDSKLIKEHDLKFHTDIAVWEDVLFVFEYIRLIDTIVYDTTPYYNYMFAETSISHEIHSEKAVANAYSAVTCSKKMLMELQDSDPATAILRVRMVKNALAVLRLIELQKSQVANKKYRQDCIVSIRQYGTSVRRHLSNKEKFFIWCYCCFPPVVSFLYKVAKKI